MCLYYSSTWYVKKSSAMRCLPFSYFLYVSGTSYNSCQVRGTLVPATMLYKLAAAPIRSTRWYPPFR